MGTIESEKDHITDGICDNCKEVLNKEIDSKKDMDKLHYLALRENVMFDMRRSYFPDRFDSDYGKGCHDDFVRHAREERFCKHG
jgi:hypothetical protein